MTSGMVISNGKLTYISGTWVTDGYGNAQVLAVTQGYPVCFVPDSDSYDQMSSFFVSPVTQYSYIHLSNFTTGVAETGKTIKGKVYYISA